jgi:putative methyltransferase (TIGR04325 family)
MANDTTFFRQLVRAASTAVTPLMITRGRLRYLSPFPRRFSGAYNSFDEAISAAARTSLAGYDHQEIADVAFHQMCKVTPWDYPVLFWMQTLLADVDGLVDAGGHMGTKYRAFRDLLSIDEEFRWIVYDLPMIVRAGRLRAERDGCQQLHFVDKIEEAGEVQLFLGSGLMQYLDRPLSELLTRLPMLPRHLLLNKVALRQGRPIVTLERIGQALVPYQMRNEDAFLDDVAKLGYRLVDRWTIPSLSHVIDTHPELGASQNAGFYFTLDGVGTDEGGKAFIPRPEVRQQHVF